MTNPHLRRTYLMVTSRGECDATVVSNLTGRCRAVESNYLYQLARMGWLNKRRVSKTIHFRPVSQKVEEKGPMLKMKKLRMDLQDRGPMQEHEQGKLQIINHSLG
jgi:hypothetical protein